MNASLYLCAAKTLLQEMEMPFAIVRSGPNADTVRLVTDAPPEAPLADLLTREINMQHRVMRIRTMRDRALFYMNDGATVRVVDAELEPGSGLDELSLPPWPVSQRGPGIGRMSMRDQLQRMFEEGLQQIHPQLADYPSELPLQEQAEPREEQPAVPDEPPPVRRRHSMVPVDPIT